MNSAPTVVPTLQLAFQAASALTEARAGVAIARHAEAEAEAALEAARLRAELAAITAAGSEAALGPNETARKRALACALDQAPAVQAAIHAYREAALDRRLSEADADLAGALFQVYLAAINADQLHLPAAWLPHDLRADEVLQ